MAGSFPTKYDVPPECQRFFEFVGSSTEVQEKLFKSKEISEVSQLARDHGYNVTTAQILKAQAGRVICTLEDNEVDNINLLLAAQRSKTGAQWGRECEGYLDAAGYWMLEVHNNIKTTGVKNQIIEFLDKCNSDESYKEKLIDCLSFNAVHMMALENGCTLPASDLLEYQARTIMTHPDDLFVERIANGRLALI